MTYNVFGGTLTLLSSIQFKSLYISQGSVALHLRCIVCIGILAFMKALKFQTFS